MRQSRLTVWTSSAVVTDQKPSSAGRSLKNCSVRWIGHSARMRLKTSCGGPSSHSSSSVSSMLRMSPSTVAIETSLCTRCSWGRRAAAGGLRPVSMFGEY